MQEKRGKSIGGDGEAFAGGDVAIIAAPVDGELLDAPRLGVTLQDVDVIVHDVLRLLNYKTNGVKTGGSLVAILKLLA